jgi:toxin ParE1/3/4
MIYDVTFAPDARDDLKELFDFIAADAGSVVARDYIAKIHGYCFGFDLFPERGMLRDDMRPGLRLVGFQRQATIAFTVQEDRVLILRIFYGGRDVNLQSNIGTGNDRDE